MYMYICIYIYIYYATLSYGRYGEVLFFFTSRRKTYNILLYVYIYIYVYVLYIITNMIEYSMRRFTYHVFCVRSILFVFREFL